MRFAASAVLAGVLAGVLAPAPTAGAEPQGFLAGRAEPGPNLPPAGRSLFDELFAVGPPAVPGQEARHAIPYPFERLLAAVNARIAPAKATALLIPLGRSLQRFAASPDYFASPRIVVSVPEDSGAPDRPLLKDRLFIGYQERAGEIEVISYNETAGRFEFQVIEDYGERLVPRVEYAERTVCVTCHQGHGPIFPTALWSETNANARLGARLQGLGAAFHGVAVRAGVDRADEFDRSTDRAARIAFTNAVWNRACGEPDDADAAQCRGDLLLAALRYRLGGARGVGAAAKGVRADLARHLHGRSARAAPQGLRAPSPDLPNRDPLMEVEAGVRVDDAIEADGVFEPSLPRPPVVFSHPAQPPADLLADIIHEIGFSFADADIVWLDARLAAQPAPELLRHRVPCRARALERAGGSREVRLDCGHDEATGRAELQGYVTLANDAPPGGLIRSLVLPDREPLQRLAVQGRARPADAGDATLEVPLREAALALSARLAGGERLAPVLLRLTADDHAEVELAALDDLAPLRAAIARMVEAAGARGIGALAAGPLRRGAVLAELRAALEGG